MKSLYSEEAIDEFVAQATRRLIDLRHAPAILRPSNPLTRLLPGEVRRHMPDLICEDLDEMAHCVANSLWTAGALMAFRLFEETVMIHVSEDLGISLKQMTLQKAIAHLKKNFSPEFMKQLEKIRKSRNNGMHSAVRFDPNETLEIIELVLWLTVEVFSIPPK